MEFKDIYGTDIPLSVNDKGKYYLPEKIFCDALGEDMILVNTPAVGVITYKVNKNKDGSMWIKGDNISKYYQRNNKGNLISRLFLTDEMIEKLNQ